MVEPKDVAAKVMPDCDICGWPFHQHSGGYPNFCPIVATYRPAEPPEQKP